MAYKARTTAVHQIFLDTVNPRHDAIDNEPAIIQRLLQAENVKNLASDIAKYGLSPLDRMAVVPHPTQRGKVIVAEGNRRLCAIKLLADPEKAPTEPIRKIFRELRKGMTAPITELEVIVFDTKVEARHWLELRHEGPQEGAGTKPWNPSQKARFNAEGKGDNPNVLALQLIDYASVRGLITEHQREKLNLTTITRFLSNPVFRDALGLVSNKTIEIRAQQQDFDRALRRFLTDSLKSGSDVHSRTDKAERVAYANKLRAEGISPPAQHTAPITLDPKTGSAPSGSSLASPPLAKRRDSRSPKHRQHVIPADFTCHISNKIHKRIYDELKKIDPDEFSFSGTYLFRAMIEMTTRAYCKKHGIPIADRADLDVAIGRAEQHLQANGVPPAKLKPLRVMASNRHASYSPESLGNTIHGGSVPTKRQLIDNWDSIEEGLKVMLDRL